MNGEDREDPSLFPYGLTSSPDAKHITEAIEAAVSSTRIQSRCRLADSLHQADLLRLVTDRLHPGGALPYLRMFVSSQMVGVRD